MRFLKFNKIILDLIFKDRQIRIANKFFNVLKYYNTVGIQNESSQNVLHWHADYFELKLKLSKLMKSFFLTSPLPS